MIRWRPTSSGQVRLPASSPAGRAIRKADKPSAPAKPRSCPTLRSRQGPAAPGKKPDRTRLPQDLSGILSNARSQRSRTALPAPDPPKSNFAFLEPFQPLARLGFLAERLYAEDPCSTLLRLRQFGEVLARKVAERYGVHSAPQDNQAELLALLRGLGLNREVLDLFHGLRRAGNAAAHEMLGDARTALQQLRMARALGQWYVRLVADRTFEAPPLEADSQTLTGAIEKSRRGRKAKQESSRAKRDRPRWKRILQRPECPNSIPSARGTGIGPEPIRVAWPMMTLRLWGKVVWRTPRRG